ncbi:Na+/H+ antiporter subunit D [Nesterenkonia alkaliphila]|uniref:Na+/H+ antiporter subunit D n=1 Tax=Nesterenkonia alkaliphila TaxID=1463631 RepID=A0A7K1UEM0_9MICC|nr:Na+/H+ antiporter subunit D [Nesterenkonia alkaliphila]MVT24908.1 Na+/H+ antiporter subunit D [Nesterenkonia alkaliphila]GFZ90782.1 Na+/H+ antiporter subunit D [Nesterenkonia alkaliphila]
MDLSLIEFVPLAVLLPFFGAAFAFAFYRNQATQKAITIGTLIITVVLEIVLLTEIWHSGAHAVNLAGWPAPFGITMVIDRFSALMLVVSSIITLAVLLYAVGQGAAEEKNDAGPVSIFYPTYLILVAGVSNAFLAGDLFNLYVGFEIFLTASYVLLTLGGGEARIRAGVTYVVVSILSSMLFLITIGLVYAATGTVNLADIALKVGELDHGVQLLLHVMLLVAFGIKAAVFPLAFWLPDSYPTAPAPVTAVFAGLLTKVGIYAMIRTETLLFPGERINTALMIVAGLTMIVGILGALAQADIKRMLSFTLISHIGYLVFGLALSSIIGMAATIYYVAHHITIQTTLFLVTGLIERRAGTSNVERLGGLARISPVLAILFFIPAMNLAGIPPFSGFVGKLGMMQGGIAENTWITWILVFASVVTSLLTLLAVARIWARGFWRKAEDVEDPERILIQKSLAHARAANKRLLPATMVVPTAALVALSLVFTVAAGPLMNFSRAAAQDMYERTPYLEAVLGEERVDGVREDLKEFTEGYVIDLDTGDDGAEEFAPVRTSLQPDMETDAKGSTSVDEYDDAAGTGQGEED